MKKFFNLILAALVIIGAAACTKSDEIVDQTQQSESLSFYANVVNDVTRAYIEKDGETTTWNTVWEGDETLQVGNYYFSNTKETPNKFTCADANATELLGKSVTISGKDHQNFNSLSGKSAYFIWTNIESFSVDQPINLTSQISFLHYTYNGKGAVTLKLHIEHKNGSTIESLKTFRKPDGGSFEYVEEMTFEGKGEIFVPFWIGLPEWSDTNATLSYSIDGVKCKETTIKNICWGKVYNLGTLAEPEPKEVFLVPGVWASDGARFAVYETATETWTNMTPVTGEFGLYSAEVSSSKIIFARMNPSTSENKWDNKWNQTADLDVPTDDNNCYYITDWDKGEWRAYTPIEWAIAGTFLDANWKKEEKMSKVSDSVYSLKNQTLKAHDEFKVKVFGDKDWKTSFGPISFSFFTPGHWQTAGLNASGNFSVDRAGTYDFYLDVANTRIYVVNAGSDYTAAPEQKTEGQAPEQDADAPMLYLKPNSNWLQANARFAAYFFGNGERWVSMTDSDSDGIYEVAIPTDKKFPKIIFCRMNPSATANDWGNKWNQTSDLVIPTNGNNLYTVKEGTWDKGGGTWSVK